MAKLRRIIPVSSGVLFNLMIIFSCCGFMVTIQDCGGTGDGKIARWHTHNGPTVHYQIHYDSLSSLSDEPGYTQLGREQAIIDAADQWNDSDKSDFTWNYFGRYSGRTTLKGHKIDCYRPDTRPNNIFASDELHQSQKGALAGTAIYFCFEDGRGQIRGFDIMIATKDDNGNPRKWSTAANPAVGRYDLQGTIAHELGHALGLEHKTTAGSTVVMASEDLQVYGDDPPCVLTPDSPNNATMCKRAPPGSKGERSLHQDDIDGLNFLYPTSNGTSVSVYHGEGGRRENAREDHEEEWIKVPAFTPSTFQGAPVPKVYFYLQWMNENTDSLAWGNIHTLEYEFAAYDSIEIAIQLDKDCCSKDELRYRIKKNGRVIYQEEFGRADVRAVRMLASDVPR